jgi:hypothetical protein
MIGFATSCAVGLVGAAAAKAVSSPVYDPETYLIHGEYKGIKFKYSMELARDWSEMYGTPVYFEFKRGIHFMLEQTHNKSDHTMWIGRYDPKTGKKTYLERRCFLDEKGEACLHFKRIKYADMACKGGWDSSIT